MFVPLSLVALHNVAEQDSGVASSLLNTGQQVGGAIGLALLGTVAWSAVANSLRSQAAAAAGGVHPSAPSAAALQSDLPPRPGDRVLPGLLVSAGVMVLALIIAMATIRVSRQDLAGDADPSNLA